MQRNNTHDFQQGLTMLEVSIGILILGLVIAGVVGGQYLIENAAENAVNADMEYYSNAADQFETIYGAMPGDIADFTSHFPGEVDGNGNGEIDCLSESLQFWRHLALAGLVKGSYDGVTDEPGIGVPAGAVEGSAIRIQCTTTPCPAC